MKRTLVRLALAALFPLTIISAVTLTSAPAVAKTSSAATISCNTLKATINWNPPLVPGSTATSKTTQITFDDVSVSGCTTTPASHVTAATSVTAVASLTTHGNACESLISSTGKPTTYTFTINWNGGGGTSKVVFKGSHTNISPPSFELENGVGTGAFATKDATAIADPSNSQVGEITECIGGIKGDDVSSVTIVGGSVSL